MHLSRISQKYLLFATWSHPQPKDLQALEDALVANVPESVMSNLPTFTDRKYLDDLVAPS
ncbi:hypothetical protein L208DRAFT_1383903 [Tricholoma matsutake]|nr:hypothetical protein L208DRAFT_1383903 [Tricholoma matsutake 945]